MEYIGSLPIRLDKSQAKSFMIFDSSMKAEENVAHVQSLKTVCIIYDIIGRQYSICQSFIHMNDYIQK